MTNFDHAYQAAIAAAFRRRNVSLTRPGYREITLDPSEYAVLVAADQMGRLAAREAAQ